MTSNDFSDVASALRLMFSDCAFKMPDPKTESQDDPQLSLLSKK